MYQTNEELERMWWLMGVPQVADAFDQLREERETLVELGERTMTVLSQLGLEDPEDVIERIKNLTEALKTLESEFFCKNDKRHELIEQFLKAPEAVDFDFLIDKFNEDL